MRREFPQRFCQALRKAFNQGELQFDGDAELAHLRVTGRVRAAGSSRWKTCPGSCAAETVGIAARQTSARTPRRKVVQYLANYVGRIALSDSRILDIQGDQVLFKYKDYRDNNQQKAEWIEGVELIHRFLQHLLPPGFRHIRRYGWMGPRVKPEKRDFIRQLPRPG